MRKFLLLLMACVSVGLSTRSQQIVFRGHVYNDNNQNGTRDSDEPYRANFKIRLSNGLFTTTDNSGSYYIKINHTGNYSLSCDAPAYFNAIPAAYQYQCSGDTVITNDFAFIPYANVKGLSISVTPLVSAARKGFPMPYDITYENTGSTDMAPEVLFTYDNTKLLFDSCSNAAAMLNGNSLLINDDGLKPGERRSFTAYFHVNINTGLGENVTAGAVAVEGSISASDEVTNQIKGSFDPNDKSATPSLSPQELTDGKYIYYIIRFQNKGNDTAFDVRVLDTLNNNLDYTTLQVLASSHPCITTVKDDNTVAFEFMHINLPDSATNELKSHGYISFRVRPYPTIQQNTSIPNQAAIYFDFNPAVMTNVAVTEYTTMIVVPMKLISFDANLQQENKALVNWTTSNENNLKEYVIELSTDAVNFKQAHITMPAGNVYNVYSEKIDVPKTPLLYIRLRITDKDGTFSFSPVVTLKNNQAANPISFLQNTADHTIRIMVNNPTLINSTAVILNAQGAVTKKFILYGNNNIDTRSFSSGWYVLKTQQLTRSFLIVN